MYVPQILIPALLQLEKAFVDAKDDPAFVAEFQALLTEYAGRPTPLTLTRNLTKGTKTRLYLKREDLLHGGAHKTNQVLGQALLAKRMGKHEIIAETGAGQHGVATALACALLGLKCRVYMGAKGLRAPEAQRISHEADGRHRHPGALRLQHPQRCLQRGAAGLGCQL